MKNVVEKKIKFNVNISAFHPIARFLKGTCDKVPCLLSHNTTLSKMPTCKFYLLGMCSKTDCPYLHKKVNDKTEICLEFLRGFCEKAEEVGKIVSKPINHINISLFNEFFCIFFRLSLSLHLFLWDEFEHLHSSVQNDMSSCVRSNRVKAVVN